IVAICLELSRTPKLPKLPDLSHKGDAMKRLMMATPIVALALVLLSTPDASAFGRRKRHCAEDCAPGCAPAPTSVAWVEQTVTAYRTEWRSRQVAVEVSRPVDR